MSVLDIQFDNPERDYAAGGMVSGQISILVSEQTPCLGVVLEYWWQASGAGVSDRGNIYKLPISLDSLENHLSINPPSRAQRRANDPIIPQDDDTIQLTRTAIDDEREALILEPRETYWLPFYFPAPPGPVSYRSDQLTIDWKLRARLYSETAPLKVERIFITTPGSATTVNLGTLDTASKTAKPDVTLPSLTTNVAFVLLGVFALVALAWYMLPLTDDFPSRLEDYLSVPAAVVIVVYLVVTFRVFVNATRARRFYQNMQTQVPNVAVPGQTFDVILRFLPRFSSPRQHLYTQIVVEAFEKTRSSSQQQQRCVYSRVLEHSNVIDLVSGKNTKVLERFQFPEDAFASFASEHHRITWHVRLDVQFGNLPGHTSRYPITVQPWSTPNL